MPIEATPKQINYIIILLQDYIFKDIWETIPKNDEFYHDTRADYRRLIIEKHLRSKGLTSLQASTLIEDLRNERVDFVKMTINNIIN
jgi:hypothetical protein